MNGLFSKVFVVSIVKLKIDYAGAAVQVNVGGQYSFSCGITGTSVKTYMWQKQISSSSFITLFDDPRHTGTKSNIMTITNIEVTDAGTYQCVVTLNSGVIETFSTYTLQVVSSTTVINGNWGSWISWSSCSVTCGDGVQTRTRLCNNPVPANGGSDCSSSGTESQICNTGVTCLEGTVINGNWGPWTSWSGCSVTCGGGTQTRTRQCNNPAPANGGADCSGSGTESQSCNTSGCPVHGNWGGWSGWSGCSVTCGNGVLTRTRQCNNPPPSNNGNDCNGSSTDTQSCYIAMSCPIHGDWGDWSDWSGCSVTCGNGVLSRTRQCNNPPPSNNGNDCSGSSTDTQSCYIPLSCPVNGNWGSWASWSVCSVTCGEGSQTKTRLCNSPVPSNDGSDCIGSGTESQTCHAGVDCLINGNWGAWTSWSVCSGNQTRTGQCTNPAPANGGSDCVGSGTETQSCYTGSSCNCQASTSSLNEKSQSAIIGVLVAVIIILLIAVVVLIIHHRRRMKECSSIHTVIKDSAQGSRHDYANDLVNEHVSYLKLDRRSGSGTSVTETNYDDLQISNDGIGKDDRVYYEIKPETA